MPPPGIWQREGGSEGVWEIFAAQGQNRLGLILKPSRKHTPCGYPLNQVLTNEFSFKKLDGAEHAQNSRTNSEAPNFPKFPKVFQNVSKCSKHSKIAETKGVKPRGAQQSGEASRHIWPSHIRSVRICPSHNQYLNDFCGTDALEPKDSVLPLYCSTSWDFKG